MPQSGLIHAETTEGIIKSFYHVYNSLGFGFLEKVYENSMRLSLEKSGFAVRQQFPIDVIFEGVNVGNYFADLLVDDKVVIELKAAQAISPEHEAQLLNYLKATGLKVGLLLNFGPKAEFRRKVFTHIAPWDLQEKLLPEISGNLFNPRPSASYSSFRFFFQPLASNLSTNHNS